MFGEYAAFGDGAVDLLVFLAQGVVLASFFLASLSCPGVWAIPCGREIDDGFRLRMQSDTGLLEQANVVTAPRVVGKANNRAGSPVNDELRLQRVARFLVRIVPALFFLSYRSGPPHRPSRFSRAIFYRGA